LLNLVLIKIYSKKYLYSFIRKIFSFKLKTLFIMSNISINTNPDSEMFEGEYKYPEWYNKKKYIFYNKVLARLDKLSYIHTRSSQYYDRMNYYILGPSITITAVSSIASFLSTSDFINNDTQNAFGVSVGVIASISSVMQAIAGACQFSAKKEGHRAAAEDYNNLMVKTKFEIEMPNEENFADDLEVLILAVQNKCKYFPPQFIVDEYESKKEKRIRKRIDRINTSTSRNIINYSNNPSVNVIDDETDTEENNSLLVNNDHENVRITVENPNYNTFSNVDVNNSINSTENTPTNSPTGSNSSNTVV
jgi:hypothetical protein